MAPQTESELRALIRTQTEITATGLDLNAIMELIAERAQELTRASAGVIELAEEDEMVYAIATGEAAPICGPARRWSRPSRACASLRAECCEATTPVTTLGSTLRPGGDSTPAR